MLSLLKSREVQIDRSRIRIEKDDLLRLLGEQPEIPDSHTSGLMEEYVSKCCEMSSPAGVFILVKATEPASADSISIQDHTFHTGRIIQNMLRHAEYYAFFLVTAGPGPENLARNLLNEGNYLEGYLTDMAASALVDSAADQVQSRVRKVAQAHGLLITNRYSPGYCSWDVREQQKLFSLFPEGSCGISLLESSLMNPVKSISGIIGLGTRVIYRDNTCAICSMKNCPYRKETGRTGNEGTGTAV